MSKAKLPAEIPDLGKVLDTELAQRYGVSHQRISQIRRAHGIPAHQTLLHSRVREERQGRLAKVARQCHSYREMARVANVPPDAAYALGRSGWIAPALAEVPQVGTVRYKILEHLYAQGPLPHGAICGAVAPRRLGAGKGGIARGLQALLRLGWLEHLEKAGKNSYGRPCGLWQMTPTARIRWREVQEILERTNVP